MIGGRRLRQGLGVLGASSYCTIDVKEEAMSNIQRALC